MGRYPWGAGGWCVVRVGSVVPSALWLCRLVVLELQIWAAIFFGDFFRLARLLLTL
jgi:hypothetical protein